MLGFIKPIPLTKLILLLIPQLTFALTGEQPVLANLPKIIPLQAPVYQKTCRLNAP
jgi:hypothetical protein